MIRSNQRFFNILHVMSDGVLIYLSFLMAFILRFQVMDGQISTAGSDIYFKFAMIAVPIQLTLYGCFKLYGSQRRERFLTLFYRLCICNLIGYAILLMGLFWMKEVHFSRLSLIYFLIFETFSVTLKRFVLIKTLQQLRKQGQFQRNLIVLGSGELAQLYVQEIQSSPHLGYQINGYLAPKQQEESFPFLEYMGDYEALETVLDYYKPDEVILALDTEEYAVIGDLIHICEKTGSKMSIIPFYTQYLSAKPQVDFLNHIPLLQIRAIPLEHFGWAFLKRTMDILGSALLILLLSPLLLCLAIGVKCSSPGPIIFTQTRVGLNKKNFKMYKFRSMVQNDSANHAWSRNHDTRKTKFGSYIRKYSLDELPQLFNVLKGEMSLVGPRPEIPHFVEQFKVDIPHYMVKHQVRPGITGYAQINGFRGDTSIEERIKHDLHYIEHWSLFLDLYILFKTLFTGMVNQEKIKK